MNQIDKVLKEVRQRCKDYYENKTLLLPNTNDVAQALKISRTSASKALNTLFEQHLLGKINVRPVIYFNFDTMNIGTPDILNSVDELNKLIRNNKVEKSLNQIIGAKESLHDQIEQMKAAIFYPKNGLPMILFGSSGTGKSFMAQSAYNYAVAIGILKRDAPFISINCAQYANNPELLSSMLFGYVKGAFTGADSDKLGALAEAKDGILFLDEIQRLNPEGQERLFTYMDTGYYSPLGDEAKSIKSNARLIFATTASQENFLTTFLRRIPIKIKLPDLIKRSLSEKKQIVNSFINNEARNLGKNIQITELALQSLYDYNYQANVGEVKNTIKNIVATAYIHQRNQKEIVIGVKNLPDKFLLKDKISKDALHNLNNRVEFSGYIKCANANFNNSQQNKISQSWKYAESMAQSGVTDRHKYEYIINSTIDYVYFSAKEHKNIKLVYIIKKLRSLLKLLNYPSDFFENNKLIYGLAVYIFCKNYFDFDLGSNTENTQRIADLFRREITFIEDIQDVIESQFEVSLSKNDIVWLAIYCANSQLPIKNAHGIIICHGYATASSIAETCNRILSYPVFSSIDMSLNINEKIIARLLQEKIREINNTNGVVVLVDMGSLVQISKNIAKTYNYPFLLIDQVNTGLALDIGNMILENKTLTEISARAREITVNTKLFESIHKKKAIVTTCMTGIGTAEEIRKMLTRSFEGLVDINIYSVEFSHIKQEISTLKKNNFEIIAIVGTDNPHFEGIPYLGLEDIISGEKLNNLAELLNTHGQKYKIREMEHQLIKNFSINRVIDSLTILSANSVISNIDTYVDMVQKDLNCKFSNRVQIALYVHISSLIERLIRGNPIKIYEGDNSLIHKNNVFSVLKRDFSVLSEKYKIKINDAEIAYIKAIIEGY